MSISIVGTNVNSVLTLGLYDSNANGFPTNRLGQGTVSGDTTGLKSVTGLSLNLVKGNVYWIAVNVNGVNNVTGLTVPQTSSLAYANAFVQFNTLLSATFNPTGYFASSQTSLPTTWTSTGQSSTVPIAYLSF